MIKVGDWTDIGKISKIKEVVFTEDSLKVQRKEAKVGDTFTLWASEDGIITPFEPLLSTEEEVKKEKLKSELAMAEFFKGNPRFTP